MKTPQSLMGFDTTALANRWQVSRSTLENWRSLGKDPTYQKIGGKVIYLQEDVIDFEESSKRTSTAHQTV